jgi:2-oxoglutarate dehydrogenase complex dehydrogenase (E1) component-like enzyme
LEEMKHVYCEQVSFEYMHITSKAERDYIASKIEHIEEFTPSKESLIESYHSVSKDWAFASFL